MNSRCGLNLEQTTLSFIEQIPTAKITEIRLSERRLEKLGRIAFGGFTVVGLAAVIGMIYTILVKFILNGSNVITGVIFILLLVFAVLGLAYVIFNESLKEKKLAVKKSYIEPALEMADTVNLLEEKQFEPVPSVIENTTDQLHVENKTRKLE